MSRPSRDGRASRNPWCCDNFLYGFKGTPSARQPGRPPPRSGAGSRSTGGLIRRNVPPIAAEVAGGPCRCRAGLARRSFRAEALVAAAAPRIAAPHRPQTVPAAAPLAVTAGAERPSSSRRASCRRAKITFKSARCARVLRMALRATLDTDLPRQDLGTYQEDGTTMMKPPNPLGQRGEITSLGGSTVTSEASPSRVGSRLAHHPAVHAT